MKMMLLPGPTAVIGHAPNAGCSKSGRIRNQGSLHRVGSSPSGNKDAKTCGEYRLDSCWYSLVALFPWDGLARSQRSVDDRCWSQNCYTATIGIPPDQGR
jgi:hypothetical protein